MKDYIWAMTGFVLCLAFPDVKLGALITVATVTAAKFRDVF